MYKILLMLCIFAAAPGRAAAAVGCDLNDPDRDVARLFPGSTGYKTRYVSLKTSGGQPLLDRVEKRLGDKFHGLYENIDVPYTLYDIYRGTQTLGYIHGVNQKGEYGGIQVFLALDSVGVIKSFYIQKLTSRAAKDLRAKEFAAQFAGLALKDFEGYDPVASKAAAGSPSAGIKAPAKAGGDFNSVMRAVKKNLILMDEFVFSKKAK
ncbi:MAG TPA: hypothetical protein PKI19_11935 [Elusimicrobiales bacterium]|nr:hypothetical protein [Elusimicrobiales bacterium]